MCKNGQISEETVQHPQFAVSKVITNDVHRSRLVYNSRVKPKEIEALFAKRTGSTRLSPTRLPIVFGQVIRARVVKPQNNNKIVKSVANDQSVVRKDLGIQIDNTTWRRVFYLIFNVEQDNNLIWFQYKLIHLVQTQMYKM